MGYAYTADHIAAQSGGFEPQRLNHWTLQIAGLGNGDVLELSLQNFQMPTPQIDTSMISYGNEKRKVASSVTISDGNLVVVDYVDKDTWRICYNWFKLVYDARTGRIGNAAEYKKEATLILFGQDLNVARRWTLIGLFPTGCGPEQFSMESGEKNMITMPLSCDKVVPQDEQ